MQLYLGGRGLAPNLGGDQTVRIIFGVPPYLAAIALLASAIGPYCGIRLARSPRCWDFYS